MELHHYSDSDNEMKSEVIDFIFEYNEEFSEFDYSIVEQCNHWLLDNNKELKGKEAIRHYYESLCDELIVITNKNTIVACRFVEYDEDDNYMRNRVDNYQIGLNLTFALVDKKYRKQGLWNRMFEFTKENILPKYSKADRFYLATSSENKPMRRGVESAGFEQVGFERNDRGDGVHTLIYCYINN